MKTSFQRDKVLSISLAHLLHDTFSAFLAPMLPLLIAKLGISLSLAATLDIARKIPSLFNPLIGLAADRSSVKWLLIIAPAITAVCMSFVGIAPGFAVLFILLFVSGISSALFHVPAPVLVKNFSGSQSATGMSWFMFGGEMARSLGPLLITAALGIWGLPGSLSLLPLGLLASFLLMAKLRHMDTHWTEHQKNSLQNHTDRVRDLGRFFIFISSYQLARGGMKAALTLYLPTYMIQQGYSLISAGLALSLFQFTGAAGTLGTGWIADRIGHRRSLLISALVSPPLMFGFIHAPGIWKLPMLIMLGLLLFASSPVILAMVQDRRTRRPAFVNGMFMSLNFGISSLMVFLTGALGDQFGLDHSYTLCAGFALLALPALLILPKENHPS